MSALQISAPKLLRNTREENISKTCDIISQKRVASFPKECNGSKDRSELRNWKQVSSIKVLTNKIKMKFCPSLFSAKTICRFPVRWCFFSHSLDIITLRGKENECSRHKKLIGQLYYVHRCNRI